MMKLEKTRLFLIKNAYENQCYADGDYLTVCRFCGHKGWLPKDIKHGASCELKPVLEELAKAERKK